MYHRKMVAGIMIVFHTMGFAGHRIIIYNVNPGVITPQLTCIIGPLSLTASFPTRGLSS